MSKELPYFRFEPAGWKFGKIQKRTKSAKVAFIDLCCKYWHDECVMKLADAELDFGDKEIKELVHYKVIKVVDGMVKIEFLDEQLVEIELIRDKNRANGKKSAFVRSQKKSTVVEQSLSVVEGSQESVEPNSTYNRIGDKSIGDNILIETFFKDFPTSSYLEQIAMDLKVQKEKIIESLPAFRKNASTEYQTMAKFADHIKRWYGKVYVPTLVTNPHTTSLSFKPKNR